MLRTSKVSRELHRLQEQLHELGEGTGAGLLEKAKALEADLGHAIESAEEHTEQLELLMEFSSILNSSLDTGTVRELAMKATCKLLRTEGATMYLLDEEKNELYFESIVGSVTKAQLKEIRLAIDERSIVGSVALHRKSIIINDVAIDKKHFKEPDENNRFTTKNMLCAPVETQGKLLGVLQAINRKDGQFDPSDLRLLEALAHQVAIAVDNASLYGTLRSQFLETVMAMATAIDAKDRYTGGHTKRVALYSELIAKHMGLSTEDVAEVKLSATLHDIGKIGVDDKVLKKEAPLDRREWEHMKQHPELGYKILAHVKTMKAITDGMRFHHERPDGLGYPCGLKGEEIPMVARIISVADTFDAMTSNRPYRKGLDYDVAFEEIVRHRGTQFDEKVVDGFINAFKLERMGKKRTREKK